MRLRDERMVFGFLVQALRIALPRTAIIHHCANEVAEAGPRGAKRQAILDGKFEVKIDDNAPSAK